MLSALASLVSPAFWRSQIAKRKALAFDQRYGADTRVKVAVEDMRDVDAALARHAVHYEASTIPKFERAMNAIRHRLGARLGDFTFIDVGSGKGLVVMLASRLPFRAVVGVEMAPELHRIAHANLQAFERREKPSAPVQLVCTNALELPLPQGDLIAYLYNPFDQELTQSFVRRLTAAVDASGSRLLVAYINPVHKDVFAAHPGFAPLYGDATLVVYEYTPKSPVR